MWWTHVCAATRQLGAARPAALRSVRAIGLSYQMHGLVLLDRALRVLRPAILWCDSRAVDIGREAFQALGASLCMRRLLNSPGNFTASKLKWVKDNEPDVFARVHKAMLPGDYVALRMTGEAVTTPVGLSEGILWDFQAEGVADVLLAHYGIPPTYIPPLREVFSVQGLLRSDAAGELGLPAGIPLAYRGGDQPNNALSLNVMEPGESGGDGGNVGGHLRSQRHAAGRPARSGQHVSARQPSTPTPALRHPAVHQRGGQPVPLAAAYGDGAGNGLRRHEPSGGDCPHWR